VGDQAGFVFAASQFGRQTGGGLLYANPVTGDLVQSLDIDSIELSGPNNATFSGDCFNGDAPCTFGNGSGQRDGQQLCDRGHRLHTGGRKLYQRSNSDLTIAAPADFEARQSGGDESTTLSAQWSASAAPLRRVALGSPERGTGVCVELQFTRLLESEIYHCSVVASDMSRGLRSDVLPPLR